MCVCVNLWSVCFNVFRFWEIQIGKFERNSLDEWVSEGERAITEAKHNFDHLVRRCNKNVCQILCYGQIQLKPIQLHLWNQFIWNGIFILFSLYFSSICINSNQAHSNTSRILSFFVSSFQMEWNRTMWLPIPYLFKWIKKPAIKHHMMVQLLPLLRFSEQGKVCFSISFVLFLSFVSFRIENEVITLTFNHS